MKTKYEIKKAKPSLFMWVFVGIMVACSIGTFLYPDLESTVTFKEYRPLMVLSTLGYIFIALFDIKVKKNA